MISTAHTRDNARGDERAWKGSLTAVLIRARFRPTQTAPRCVITKRSTMRLFICTLLCALTLSTNVLAVAWEAAIERDALGVPHIFGETDADMAYGLAWAQSEDGWEILEETLPFYRGNAASFFGRDAAVTDYLIQWLGFGR